MQKVDPFHVGRTAPLREPRHIPDMACFMPPVRDEAVERGREHRRCSCRKKPSSGEARLQHMFEVEGPPHGCLRNVVARRGLCDPKRIGIRRRIARGGAMRGGVSDPSLRGHSRTDHHARSLRASRSLRRAAQRHRGGRRRLSVESRRLLRQPADPVALFARAVETVRKRPAIRFKATA